MGTVSQQKALLRKKIIAGRQSLFKEVWERKSSLIKEKILSSKEFKSAKKIHCFISMNERFEVNTHELIKEMLLLNKEVVVPVTDFEKGTLLHSRLFSIKDLKPNKWGVLEPLTLDFIEPYEIDLILVPLLAADESGNRLGYGKGFYDRFLEKTKAFSCGLIFSEFILELIPTDSFDKKLNALISEKGFIYT